MAFSSTSFLAVTTALSGMLTTALETPSTPSSADRTFLTQPTPQVMPVIFRLTVLVSSSAAFTSVSADLHELNVPATTAPMGRAATAQNVTIVDIFFMVLFVWFGLKDAFPNNY
jgi:hypothetical protein